MKYIFKMIRSHYRSEAEDIVEHTVNSDFLDDVLEAMTSFLKGCGYADYGNLEFVKDEEETVLVRGETRDLDEFAE